MSRDLSQTIKDSPTVSKEVIYRWFVPVEAPSALYQLFLKSIQFTRQRSW